MCVCLSFLKTGLLVGLLRGTSWVLVTIEKTKAQRGEESSKHHGAGEKHDRLGA